MVISLFILCFASTFAFSSTNKEKRLEALSDSISNKIGQKDFMPFYQEYMSLARQQNDTVNIEYPGIFIGKVVRVGDDHHFFVDIHDLAEWKQA